MAGHVEVESREESCQSDLIRRLATKTGEITGLTPRILELDLPPVHIVHILFLSIGKRKGRHEDLATLDLQAMASEHSHRVVEASPGSNIVLPSVCRAGRHVALDAPCRQVDVLMLAADLGGVERARLFLYDSQLPAKHSERLDPRCREIGNRGQSDVLQWLHLFVERVSRGGAAVKACDLPRLGVRWHDASHRCYP